ARDGPAGGRRGRGAASRWSPGLPLRGGADPARLRARRPAAPVVGRGMERRGLADPPTRGPGPGVRDRGGLTGDPGQGISGSGSPAPEPLPPARAVATMVAGPVRGPPNLSAH